MRGGSGARSASSPATDCASAVDACFLVAAGALPDPFPPPVEELARAYLERFPAEASRT
jgi:hypothetical protein